MSRRTSGLDREELQFLYEIDELCDRTDELEELVAALLGELCGRLGLEGAACVLREPATGELMLRGVAGKMGFPATHRTLSNGQFSQRWHRTLPSGLAPE